MNEDQNPLVPARVLVPYHRGFQTGGPEALHQLVDSLRRLGVSAWLWPIPGTRGEGRVADYEQYEAPETTEIMDWPDTAVVLPETVFGLSEYWRSAALYAWWLSVDNAPYFSHRKRMSNAAVDAPRSLSKMALTRSYASSHRALWRDRRLLRRMTHLTQSEYARRFIMKNLLVRPTMLGDYIPGPLPKEVQKPKGKVSVAFNPKKGRELTKQIRSLSDQSITWLAIEELGRDGVGALLNQSAVYIETGHQPGKDRLPREAALHGCIVLALRRGAGANDSDCALPREHKVVPGPAAARDFAALLDVVLADPLHHRSLQADYRGRVLADRAAFDRAVRGIFCEGQRGVADWYIGSAAPRQFRD